MSRSFTITLWILCGAAVLFLSLANLEMGELNQDEGWYLYAATQVADGRLPYRDFAFTQGPMLPLVYALASPLIAWGGVGAGRLLTAVLGLLAAVLAARLASRLATPAREAGFLCFVICAVNVYQSYFTTVVKTYSLCAVFLVGGFVLLEAASRRRSAALALLSAAAMALAAGTRISSGAALLFGGLFMLRGRRSLGDAPWIAFGVGGLLTLAAMFLPFYFTARDGFVFGMIEYHALRTGGGLVYKAGFISRLVQAYFVAFALLVALAGLRWLKPRREDGPAAANAGFTRAVWMTLALITTVHFLAPFPYDDYQVPLYPLLAAVLAAGLIRAAAWTPRSMAWLLLSMLLISTAAAFSSPLNQAWMIRGRDRIWWKTRDATAMQQLRNAAALIRPFAKPGDLLLTQDTYLAVACGLRVPPGLEMGPFSYYRDWDRARAQTLHVVNRAMLDELLAQSDAPVAALSGYSLVIKAPEVDELPAEEQRALRSRVDERFSLLQSIPHFGQGATTLDILVRKTESSPR
jgi:hypothetical protein